VQISCERIPDWILRATVINNPIRADLGKFTVQLKRGYSRPVDPNLRFTAEFVSRLGSMERMRQALLAFEESEFYRGNKVEDVLLGNANEPLMQKKTTVALQSCDVLAPLNTSQMKAARMAVSHRISLIQGPPGTGKT
jgi:hypothetical protein